MGERAGHRGQTEALLPPAAIFSASSLDKRVGEVVVQASGRGLASNVLVVYISPLGVADFALDGVELLCRLQWS